jgi:hypothetical protein
MRSLSFSRLLIALLSLVSVTTNTDIGAKDILSAADIENLCRHAANDAKEFLHVAEAEGKKFREEQSVWVLGIKNLSEKWHFSEEEDVEKERLHQLALKLSRAFAAAGRVRTEYFRVATARPGSLISKTLGAMLEKPGEQWVSEKSRIRDGIGWVVYGYFIDLPGKEKPYAVLKMTDVKDRLVTWGGCFSMNPREPGHQADALYPECKKISASLDLPIWAMPKGGAFMPSTFWLKSNGESETKAEEEIFADCLIIEFLRRETLLPQARWIDPVLVKRATTGQKKEGQPMTQFDLQLGFNKDKNWQRLETFVGGHVELDRPSVKSALLKTVKLVPSSKDKEKTDAFVLSGYCSESNDFEGRRDWVRRAVELGLRGSNENSRILRVADSEAFEDADRFRDIVEIAIAQPEIPGCRVLANHMPDMSSADYTVMTVTDENVPARAIYMYLVDLKNGSFFWARNQNRPGSEPPDDSYQVYSYKVQISIRGGASDYGKHPCILWHLTDTPAEKKTKIGNWSVTTLGQDFAVSLIDPSRTFLHSIGDDVFRSGDYASMLKAVQTVQPGVKGDLHVITFQLLPRGKDERPALVVKFVNPVNGTIDWSYYDEPPGTPLSVNEEDDLLAKVRHCIEGLQKSPVRNTGATKTALVAQFGDNGLLKLGTRPYEMLVSQLAVRRNRPPIEWAFLQARGIGKKDQKPGIVFSSETQAALASLNVASIIQSDWLPSFIINPRQKDLEPRQLLIRETSPYGVDIERMGASPIPGSTDGEESAGNMAIKFLHGLIYTFINGAKNSHEWEAMEDLSQKSPVAATVLQRVLKDYEHDPGLTQNIVIMEADTKRQIISSGTKESEVSKGMGFRGFLGDPVLAGGEPDTFLVALGNIEIKKKKTIAPLGQGTLISKLYPPDWRDEYPDGRSLLEISNPNAISILRRNIEFLLKQARFTVADTLGLQNRSKSEEERTGQDIAGIDAEAIRSLGEEVDLRTVQVSLSIRDLRSFILEVEGKSHLVLSVTVNPAAEIIYPRNQIFGSLDTFRFFLVMKAPAQNGKGLQATLERQLSEAGARDVQTAAELWNQGSRKEAREFRDLLIADLATWTKDFAAFVPTIKSIANSLTADSIKLEAAYINRLRSDVKSSVDLKTLETARLESANLLKKLENWTKAHPSLSPRQVDAVFELAGNASDTHSKTAKALADSALTDSGAYVYSKAEKKLEAARFLCNQLVADITLLSAGTPKLAESLATDIKDLATKMVTTQKAHANQLFPLLKKLKRGEKTTRVAGLESIKKLIDGTITDLTEWSKLFPQVGLTVAAESVLDPKWDRGDWGKSKSKPAKTLMDASKALAEEINKYR